MTDAKNFWKSKTFWFNLLALLLAVAASQGYGAFTPDAQVGEYATVIITLMNIVLRFMTTQPVTVK